jgi:hypothetical protein
MGTIVRLYSRCKYLPAPSLYIHSEQWRYTGPFTRFQRFKGSFPGLGIATVAFGVYLAAEQAGLLGSEGGHHGDGGHHDETT